MKFEAKNIDGEFSFTEQTKIAVKRFLQTMPERVFVTFSKEYSKRSNEQNRYYWGIVIHMISEHTGYTPEETHELCKYECNYKILQGWSKETKIGMSTASLNTKQMEEYLSRVREWASFEFSLYIPLPNEASF